MICQERVICNWLGNIHDYCFRSPYRPNNSCALTARYAGHRRTWPFSSASPTPKRPQRWRFTRQPSSPDSYNPLPQSPSDTLKTLSPPLLSPFRKLNIPPLRPALRRRRAISLPPSPEQVSTSTQSESEEIRDDISRLKEVVSASCELVVGLNDDMGTFGGNADWIIRSTVLTREQGDGILDNMVLWDAIGSLNEVVAALQEQGRGLRDKSGLFGGIADWSVRCIDLL